MKPYLLILFALVSSFAFGQGETIQQFFNKYSNDESFTNVTISSKMFGLFSNLEVEKPEDKEVLEAINKLKGLRILMKEDGRNSRTLYKEALQSMASGKYDELMVIRDKDNDIKFFIQEGAAGKINELVMVLGGSEQFMALSIFGEIDLKQISKLGSKMDINGLDKLNKLDKNSSKESSDKKEKREKK